MERKKQNVGMEADYAAFEMKGGISGNTITVEMFRQPWGILTLQSVDYSNGKHHVIRERHFKNGSSVGKSTYERAYSWYKLSRYTKKGVLK